MAALMKARSFGVCRLSGAYNRVHRPGRRGTIRQHPDQRACAEGSDQGLFRPEDDDEIVQRGGDQPAAVVDLHPPFGRDGDALLSTREGPGPLGRTGPESVAKQLVSGEVRRGFGVPRRAR